MQTPRYLGIHAAKNGQAYDANPFPETTEAAWEWLAGWIAYKESIGARV